MKDVTILTHWKKERDVGVNVRLAMIVIGFILMATVFIAALVHFKARFSAVAPVSVKTAPVPQAHAIGKTAALSGSNTVVVTKEALDELVRKAADQKYLQDVLTSGPKLPVYGHRDHPLPLEPMAATGIAKTQPIPALEKPLPAASAQTMAAVNNSQHCQFQGQSYSLGEIVQTDKGWVRCTPSILINSDGSTQYGNAVWTLRDGLL